MRDGRDLSDGRSRLRVSLTAWKGLTPPDTKDFCSPLKASVPNYWVLLIHLSYHIHF